MCVILKLYLDLDKYTEETTPETNPLYMRYDQNKILNQQVLVSISL